MALSFAIAQGGHEQADGNNGCHHPDQLFHDMSVQCGTSLRDLKPINTIGFACIIFYKCLQLISLPITAVQSDLRALAALYYEDASEMTEGWSGFALVTPKASVTPEIAHPSDGHVTVQYTIEEK